MTLASSITGTGQRRPSASTTRSGPAARTVSVAVGAPSLSRTAATVPGSTSRNRSTSPSVVPGGSDTRTLPSLSTPIALRTWLGVSVLLVQDDPEDTEKPARSSSCSKVSPST
ncbi:hypothetical protein SVIOM342S_01434 [Streptomyces violaceorubidus]